MSQDYDVDKIVICDAFSSFFYLAYELKTKSDYCIIFAVECDTYDDSML